MMSEIQTQSLHSWFVNMHGAKGQNILWFTNVALEQVYISNNCKATTIYKHNSLLLPCRNLKVLLGGSRANISEDVVKRYCRLQEPLHNLCKEFHKDIAVSTTDILEQKHPTQKLRKDVLIGTKSLQRGTVFANIGRLIAIKQKINAFHSDYQPRKQEEIHWLASVISTLSSYDLLCSYKIWCSEALATPLC